MKVYDQLKKENKTLKVENAAMRVNLDRALIIVKDNSISAEREKKNLEEFEWSKETQAAAMELMKKSNPEKYKTISHGEFSNVVNIFRAGAKWYRDEKVEWHPK
jgi:hypothetical protein